MGQCMSRKAAGAFAASAAAAHSKPANKMQQKNDHKRHRRSIKSPGDEEHHLQPPSSRKQPSSHTKGVSTSFGFKRRPTTPSIAANSNAARRLANPELIIIDRNGNSHDNDDGDDDTEPLTSNVAPTGRSTPRLMPPKKEANATRINRFGFRQPQINRTHKVSDLNNPINFNAANNNVKDANRNIRLMGRSPQQTEKFMLQTTHLPRAEPIRLIETKSAKTLLNNSRKTANCNNFVHHRHEPDNVSKDGSVTEDSGVGSQISGGIGEIEQISAGVDRLNCSPSIEKHEKRSFVPPFQHKSRNLEIVMSSGNTFDVRDLVDDTTFEHSTPLPQLPSAFATSQTENNIGVYNSTGFVRARAKEYQRHLDNDNRRKVSLTSSDGFSDDYYGYEAEKSDSYKPEKSFIKPHVPKSFLKTDSSSDEWPGLGGEAMADAASSFSVSSDDQNPTLALETLMHASLNNSFSKSDIKTALLIIEDPKFAAVAAASSAARLLDDETSPVDSLFSSEAEEAKPGSNSKDINEKLTPPSPGTPTNASNSLSLSEKDDFLIDDEIADQPALVFEDVASRAGSESEPTIVDSTPKPKRRGLQAFEGSPLSLRKKKVFYSRAGSLDTLSPCESIASDDLMMDYDYSQSSGLDDIEKMEGRQSQSHGFLSLDDSLLRRPEITDDNGVVLRDWSALLGMHPSEKSIRSNAGKASARLLWSRSGTPDSPKSSATSRSRHSLTGSPLRLSRPTLSSTGGGGYESDDSLKLERAHQSAMKQDIIGIKTMLLKLRRILNEPDEDILLRSETHIPFDGQLTLINGLFNGDASSDNNGSVVGVNNYHHENGHHQPNHDNDEDANENRIELAELRRQVLFLQGQLEDKERTVQTLQNEVIKISTENYNSNSAPASTVASADAHFTCNAATQTERIRPISAGPALLNGSTTDANVGSLVSASETKRSRVPAAGDSPRKPPSKLWRQPGEPPSPPRFAASAIPRRAHSRTRTPSILT